MTLLPAERLGLQHRLAELGIRCVPIGGGTAPYPIWLLGMEDLPSAAAIGLLSPEEWQRAQRFRSQKLCSRYVAAHAGLRLLIADQFDIPSGSQQFVRNAFGKPQLAGRPDIRCSISYSGDCVLIGLARGAEIGVDLEILRPIEDALALVETQCSIGEQRALRRAWTMGRGFDRGFLRVWVRKEACVKALGCGLSIPLADLECGMGRRMTTVKFGRRQILTDVIHASDHCISFSPCDLIIGWAQLS